MIKNTGLNLELEKQQQSQEDWVFGAESPVCLVTIPEDERQNCLPVGEIQKGLEDMMDCATRGPINILETKFTYRLIQNRFYPANRVWLEENGYIVNERIQFSDAFIAIKSGTTRSGNSLIAPLKAIHDFGLIPKRRLPLESTMTFDQYHDPNRITPEMEALGAEFKRRFPINYERVYEPEFENLLNGDLLDAAGYAWPDPVDGEYPRTNNQPNHAFMLYKNPKYHAFDNYLDPVDGDFIKKLAPDYDLLDYGYRVVLTGEKVPEEIPPDEPTPAPVVIKSGFWEKILQLIKWFLTNPKTT